MKSNKIELKQKSSLYSFYKFELICVSTLAAISTESEIGVSSFKYWTSLLHSLSHKYKSLN